MIKGILYKQEEKGMFNNVEISGIGETILEGRTRTQPCPNEVFHIFIQANLSTNFSLKAVFHVS